MAGDKPEVWGQKKPQYRFWGFRSLLVRDSNSVKSGIICFWQMKPIEARLRVYYNSF